MNTAPRIVPPVYLLASLITMALLHRFAPIRILITPPWNYLAVLPFAASLMLGLPSARAFVRAGTALRPAPRSSALVTTGAFRFTRNPMYLGLILFTLAGAILLGSLSPFFVPPVLMWILRTQFIVREERWMAEQFPSEYPAYRMRVRRWI